jgi:hypothetical protein
MGLYEETTCSSSGQASPILHLVNSFSTVPHHDSSLILSVCARSRNGGGANEHKFAVSLEGIWCLGKANQLDA